MSARSSSKRLSFLQGFKLERMNDVCAIADELTVQPTGGGVVVRFPPGRPYGLYRLFRMHFPKARPVENWGWFVPGPTAARRVTLWQTRAREEAAAAARQARRAAQDLEWEAAAP